MPLSSEQSASAIFQISKELVDFKYMPMRLRKVSEFSLYIIGEA
jgi:hypothetical protein